MWPFQQTYKLYGPDEIHGRSFDYVVVGGGTAGCVLASRLSEDPQVTVLLLERGPLVDSWKSRVPLLSVDFRSASSPTYQWKSTANSVSDEIPISSMVSGKALGGTSKVNAHVYTRSTPGEYNALEASGRQGWGWDIVQRYFQRSENSRNHGTKIHRGSQGLWENGQLSEIAFAHVKQVLCAAEALGIPQRDDINDPSAPPFTCGITDHTIDAGGRRISTFDAFLPPELLAKRSNLFVCPQATVTRLELKGSDRTIKATGVIFCADTGDDALTEHYVTAMSEIILCAGAIVTPQILMLSGIGPASHLNTFDKPVVKSLPGVGANLQDHPCVPLMYKVPRADSLHEIENNPLVAAREFLRYLIAGRGLLLSPNPQMLIFALSKLLNEDSETRASSEDEDSHSPSNIPDIEITVVPYNVFDDSKLAPGEGVTTLTSMLLKPQSSGTIKLASLDARDRPICDLNYLRDPNDYVVLRKALRLGLAIGRKCREQGYPLRDFILPDSESDEDLDVYIRKNVRTTFHYSSTCKMAPESEGGVVDNELRVWGVQGLRIADASVFPSVPAAHPQAPVVMVAERCADFIKTARQHGSGW